MMSILAALPTLLGAGSGLQLRTGGQLFDRLSTPIALPHGILVFLGIGALIAGLLVLPRPMWRVTGLIVTLVHELGHGFAGLMLGRRALSIRISPDQSGLALSHGTGASAPWMTFWGYPAPALIGTLLLFATLLGHPAPALAAACVLLIVSLIFMRGLLAPTVTLLTAALAAGLLLAAPDAVLAYAAIGAGLLLLIGAWRAFGNLLAAHARGARSQSDAAILARSTGVPAFVWLLLMALVILGLSALAGFGVVHLLDARS